MEDMKVDCDFFPPFFLPQHNYLAQVTSNIWGTKFKIVGLAAFLPTSLGAGKNHICSLPPLSVAAQTEKNNSSPQWPKVENEPLTTSKD